MTAFSKSGQGEKQLEEWPREQHPRIGTAVGRGLGWPGQRRGLVCPGLGGSASGWGWHRGLTRALGGTTAPSQMQATEQLAVGLAPWSRSQISLLQTNQANCLVLLEWGGAPQGIPPSVRHLVTLTLGQDTPVNLSI